MWSRLWAIIYWPFVVYLSICAFSLLVLIVVFVWTWPRRRKVQQRVDQYTWFTNDPYLVVKNRCFYKSGNFEEMWEAFKTANKSGKYEFIRNSFHNKRGKPFRAQLLDEREVSSWKGHGDNCY